MGQNNCRASQDEGEWITGRSWILGEVSCGLKGTNPNLGGSLRRVLECFLGDMMAGSAYLRLIPEEEFWLQRTPRSQTSLG